MKKNMGSREAACSPNSSEDSGNEDGVDGVVYETAEHSEQECVVEVE
jgi:hypothetical protein